MPAYFLGSHIRDIKCNIGRKPAGGQGRVATQSPRQTRELSNSALPCLYQPNHIQTGANRGGFQGRVFYKIAFFLIDFTIQIV
jgi:hypothetical protein